MKSRHTKTLFWTSWRHRVDYSKDINIGFLNFVSGRQSGFYFLKIFDKILFFNFWSVLDRNLISGLSYKKAKLFRNHYIYASFVYLSIILGQPFLHSGRVHAPCNREVVSAHPTISYSWSLIHVPHGGATLLIFQKNMLSHATGDKTSLIRVDWKNSFIIPICSIAIFASKAKWSSSSKSIWENSTCNVTLNTALTHQTLRAVLKQNVIVTTRMSKLNKRTIVAFGQAVKSS